MSGPTPTMAELDAIGRAFLDVRRIAGTVAPGATLYVTRLQLACMTKWPRDANLTGFTLTDDGFAFDGHPVKAAA